VKIALVILHADPARGGAERYTFDLAEALARRGNDVTLLASSFGPQPDGVKCIELSASAVTKLGKYNRFLDSLDAHLNGTTYDIVHAMLPVRRCDIYHPHAGIAAEAIVSGHLKHAGLFKQTAARVFNAINIKRARFARVEKQLLESAQPPVVLCLSEYVKAAMRKHYTLPEDRLATLFNAVDLAKFDGVRSSRVRETFGIANDEAVGLMIAQDFERKGLKEAIEAWISAPARLLVVGKPDSSRYRAMAQRLGVDQKITFAGPTNDPYSFYAAADFFILPTRHDPCSLVVLESLAMGVPVISTKQNGACEIMTSGVHGFVLDSAEDHSGLVNAIMQMSQKSVCESMRQACLQLRPQLSYESHLNTLEAIYTRAHNQSSV
jgi:UDP-glucose:(heptosyl)LPS alpha-1,3-glucosyltransferase